MLWKLGILGILVGLISSSFFSLIFKKIDTKMAINQNKINPTMMRTIIFIVRLITVIVGVSVTTVIHNNAINELNKYISMGVFCILAGLSVELVTWRDSDIHESKHRH
jgi:H+/Cl- antiporter ClcA